MVMFAASKISTGSGLAELFLILPTYFAHAVSQDSRSSHHINTGYAGGSGLFAALPSFASALEAINLQSTSRYISRCFGQSDRILFFLP